MKSQKLLIIELSSIMTITDSTGMLNIAVQKDYHDICRYTKGKQSEVGTQTRMKG